MLEENNWNQVNHDDDKTVIIITYKWLYNDIDIVYNGLMECLKYLIHLHSQNSPLNPESQIHTKSFKPSTQYPLPQFTDIQLLTKSVAKNEIY